MDKKISIFQEGRGRNKAQPMLDIHDVNKIKPDKLGEWLILVRLMSEKFALKATLQFCNRIEIAAMEYNGKARDQYIEIAKHEMEEESKAKNIMGLFTGS